MPTGTLKMWNADRGYGFIQNAPEGRTCFYISLGCRRPALIPIISGRAND